MKLATRCGRTSPVARTHLDRLYLCIIAQVLLVSAPVAALDDGSELAVYVLPEPIVLPVGQSEQVAELTATIASETSVSNVVRTTDSVVQLLAAFDGRLSMGTNEAELVGDGESTLFSLGGVNWVFDHDSWVSEGDVLGEVVAVEKTAVVVMVATEPNRSSIPSVSAQTTGTLLFPVTTGTTVRALLPGRLHHLEVIAEGDLDSGPVLLETQYGFVWYQGVSAVHDVDLTEVRQAAAFGTVTQSRHFGPATLIVNFDGASLWNRRIALVVLLYSD